MSTTPFVHFQAATKLAVIVSTNEPILFLTDDSRIIAASASLTGDADEAIRIRESRDEIDWVFTDVPMSGTMDGIKLSLFIRNRWPRVKLDVASGAAILLESSHLFGSRFFRNCVTTTR